jgi:hypothetical protein
MERRGRKWADAAGAVALAFLLFFGIPARRRSWRSMLSVLALAVLFWGMSGCKGFWDAPGSTGTTTGSYTFTVTGTGNPAVTPAPATTFTVTVN